MSVRSIAQAAGVSPMTASLALRQTGRLSLATRARVLAVAKELGYAPNPRLGELMNEVRRSRRPGPHAALALLSLYAEDDPTGRMPHLKATAEGAEARAGELGFHLETFRLSAGGMTPRRLRAILEARGIGGVLCIGSPTPGETLPRELDRFALVTLGLTVASAVHRVVSHHQHDGALLLATLAERGYRRPGLIIRPDWDVRTGHGYAAACLVHQELEQGDIVVPVLRMPEFSAEGLVRWIERHRPDVLVINQPPDFYPRLEALLADRGIRVPEHLGVAFLGGVLVGRNYAGVVQDHGHIGCCGVEMLVGRMQQRDVGFPAHPKTELVPGYWVEGRSVRAAEATGAQKPENRAR
jgi:LacI family transcriptional regulator